MSTVVKSPTETFYHHVANTIKEYKRAIIQVAGDRKHLPFAYTIGNQEKNLPEILFIGRVHPNTVLTLLNALSETMINMQGAFANGEPVDLGGKYSITMYDTGIIARAEYTVQASQFYTNDDYKVQQAVMPDLNGRLPDDPLCHKNYKVPILTVSSKAERP